MSFFQKRYVALIFSIIILYSCRSKGSDFQIYDLSFDQSDGLAKVHQASFSWKIKTNENDWKQCTYQLIVASSGDILKKGIGDLWDSGKVESDKQLFVPYKGKPLSRGKEYFWKVKVWTKGGRSSVSSDHQRFIIPISYPEDWKGNWITYDYEKDAPMPLIRKSFSIKNVEKISSARFYICGLGYYEASLNGEKIGDRVLEPAQSNYDDYAFYSQYDIPVRKLKKKNALGIMLGNGWYNQYQVWNAKMAYGQPVVIAQLIIHYKTGESVSIGTDDSWKWREGPVMSTNIYAGEIYDANKEIAGWQSVACDETDWKSVRLAASHPTQLFLQTIEPIRKMGTIDTKRILKSAEKTWIFDMGQNFAGWVRLKIKGRKEQKITLRFSEEIDRNNNIDPASTGVFATKVVQTDQYICKGKGEETWEPRFTYHGFRFIEVTGLESEPSPDLLTGVVVCNSMRNAGSFHCSDTIINKLHDLALWTIKSNVNSIPTDCPHRERCGWTGDAHTLLKSLILNFDARQFMTKYLFDMRSSGREEKRELYFGESFQVRSIVNKPDGIPTMIVPGKRTSGIASPDWGTAVVQIPWQLYQYYGELNILFEFYPDMKKWVDYISGKFPNYIVNHGLGDWCPPGGNEKIDCPVPLSSTAFHYLDLLLITKTARLLKYDTDAAHYANRLNKVHQAFNNNFFNHEKASYGGQTANVMALQLGLVPDGRATEVVKSLKRNITEKDSSIIKTGIFGLGRIFPALAENGAEDLAYLLLTKKDEPSFMTMWERYHATTLWEILPVDDFGSSEIARESSHNHPMNASYDEWFFRGIGGIHPDEDTPGFKNTIFRPYFTKFLQFANVFYESPYGKIESKWSHKNGSFYWEIFIPANTTGTIYLPNGNNFGSVIMNGKNMGFDKLKKDIRFPEFYLLGQLGSGKYHIELK